MLNISDNLRLPYSDIIYQLFVTSSLKLKTEMMPLEVSVYSICRIKYLKYFYYP